VRRAEEQEAALRGSLPAPLAQLLPPPLPPPARESVRERAPSAATFSPGPPLQAAVFAGGVASNVAGSEVEAFAREVRALAAAQAAARAGGGSLAALRARKAAARLRAHLGEAGSGFGEGLPEEAALQAALKELEELVDEAEAAATEAAALRPTSE